MTHPSLPLHPEFRIEHRAPSGAWVATLDPPALQAAVDRLSAALDRRGIGSGDCVVFVGDQGPDALALFRACFARAAVFAPADPRWPVARIADHARRTAARLIVLDDALVALQHGLRSRLPQATIATVTALRDDSGTGAHAGRTPGDEQRAAAYLPTSGSTGTPRIVVLGAAALRRSAGLAVEQFHWQPGERLLNLAPPHTMSGLRNALIAAPLAGMTWIAAPETGQLPLFELLERLQRWRPQRLVAAPLLIRQINLAGARMPADALAGLRAVYCTGTDLDPEEVQRFHRRFGVPVVNYYGLTESVGLCLSQDLPDWTPDDRSLGRAVGCELRLLGDDGQPAAQGQPGELQVRQPWSMSGYLDDPQATAECFDGPWLRTGDLARQDDQGRVLLVGRISQFIKTAATERIHPRSLEALLLQHPAIDDAAACGLRRPGGGEWIALALVAAAGAAPPSDAEIADWVQQHLGPASRPGRIEWVAAVPRGAHGKILRTTLQELFP